MPYALAGQKCWRIGKNHPEATLAQQVLKALDEATRLVYGTCAEHHSFTVVKGFGPRNYAWVKEGKIDTKIDSVKTMPG